MKQLAKQIVRHHSVLVLFYAMFFSLISACEHQSLITPTKQFENSPNGLNEAIKANNLSEVKRLTQEEGISAGWDFARQLQVYTTVHLASEFGRLEILKYLVNDLNLDVNIMPKGGAKTALYLAAFWGHKDVVVFLIQAGANPRAVTPLCPQPIHSAVLGERLSIVRHLIEEAGVDPKANDMDGKQPIQLAAENGSKNIIEYLIKEAKVDPTVKTPKGNMLIHLAASSWLASASEINTRQNSETISFLVNQLHADPEAKNNAGQSPLHLAAKKGRLLMVKHLIENIRVNPEPSDHQGKTPLHLAVEGGYLKIVQYLIEEAKVNPTPMNNQFQTPLDLAKTEKRQEVVEYLEKPHSISWAIVN